MMGRNPGNASDGPRLRDAILTGALAYLVGFSLLHIAGRVVNEMPRGGASEPGPDIGLLVTSHEAAGVIFYNAHGVSVSPWDGFYALNVLFDPGIALPGSPIPRAVWMLVPAGLVTLAGVIIYQRAGSPARRARTAVGRGSWVVYGYLPPFLIGALVMDVEALGALFVGSLHPILFGGFGGYLAYRLEKSN